MVSDVTLSGAINNQAQTQASSSQLASDFSDFLTLLTVQLQNQDPLSPMETNEFTNQLVAFTGVEQQINSNQKLDDLIALQLGNATSAALGYVGQDINYVSSEFNFDGTNSNTFRYALNGEAVSSTLRILDENGRTVFETVGSTSTGQNEFIWDGTLTGGGTAQPGTYEIRVDALDSEDNGINSTIVVSGRVSGVESQNGQVFAIVGERAVSLGNILSVSDPNVFDTDASALTSALSYIDKEISYTTNTFKYDDDEDNVLLRYNIEDGAESASIRIFDRDGNQIFRDNTNAGEGPGVFVWNGTNTAGEAVANGDYRYEISAVDEDSNPIIATPQSSGIVTEIESRAGQIYLKTDTGVTVPLGDITNIQPGGGTA